MELIPLLMAIVSGGVLTKLIELISTKNERHIKLRHQEKDYLINEIDRLKTNVEELRLEVSTMRMELNEKMQINSELTARWYELKTVTAKIITHLRYNHPESIVSVPDLLVELDRQINNPPSGNQPKGNGD
jgi:predicted nuclease with TOPRIM domain